MHEQYNLFLAVDYHNTKIIFSATSSGELMRKILKAIEVGTLASNGAVRMYRTSSESYQRITQLMDELQIPFHEAAQPKEEANENSSNITA
ncbi:hypothetical protein [Leuconostoc mesenteroides]|uniref:hypothetical protein n=1 Tax=Leuconostoc mesenteroides TaxID=1245 RepID=UPI000B9D7516|nr:hypothetical protein [Leuconostoc mesenteroides]BAX72905.1 hypothetical protein LEMES_01462 [Leuconostoc mesenteroides]